MGNSEAGVAGHLQFDFEDRLKSIQEIYNVTRSR
jgi:hypothetical protein